MRNNYSKHNILIHIAFVEFESSYKIHPFLMPLTGRPKSRLTLRMSLDPTQKTIVAWALSNRNIIFGVSGKMLPQLEKIHGFCCWIFHKRNINQYTMFRLVELQRTYYCKEHFWLDLPFKYFFPDVIFYIFIRFFRYSKRFTCIANVCEFFKYI